eukprot:jgi/Phyca11/14399/fgenesh1_pg.PHYCAscaffold_7_\
MQAADMPTKLWPEVLQYIVDIDNMSATRALNGKTPYEKLNDKKPDVSKVKLSPKAEPAMLLGFSHAAPGYRLLHLRTGRIVEAKDVKFREDITVGKKYLEALLVGRHGTYNDIPYVPLPVEFVAKEAVHDVAERGVGLRTEVTSSHRETAVGNGTQEADDSSSSDSESEEDGDAPAAQAQLLYMVNRKFLLLYKYK